MDINLLVLASPVFLILIIAEYTRCLYKKLPHYQLNDSVNNFSTGIIEELGTLPLKGLILFCYYYLFEHYSITTFPSDALYSWLLLWLGVDFCYYWYHRASHRCIFFWIGHSVHHQSENYNLSVALRQGYFQTITSWIFYLPLAIIGFSPQMFIVVVALNTIYQFWIHTQSIDKMGWFETLFNTPSHHRVHHGKNPQYIDKNYAGSLIIWDKLFGTFEPEAEQPVYGVTEPLDSWNPYSANIKVLNDVLYYGKGFKNKLNVVRALFMPPEWIINQLQKEHVTLEKRPAKPMNQRSPVLFMLANLGLAIGLYTWFAFTFNIHSLFSWTSGALVLLTLYLLGKVANGEHNVLLIEILRAVVVFLICHILLQNIFIALGICILFFILNRFLINYISLKHFSTLAGF
ncbi:MAG: sterol desaturase family protein [Legionella sp.]|nr:sterol desaturase family protein [Legionella sp.]